MKYKVIESTIAHFKGIEFEADFSASKTGDTLSILGNQVVLTQAGAGVLGGVIHGATPDDSNVMYLQVVPEPIAPEPDQTVLDPPTES